MSNNIREKWSHRLDFLFVTVGSAVGLGNVWRFPYLCYKNGGGAFLIPYFLTLFLIALPQLMLQVSLGQFTSNSATRSWNILPVMRGLGYAVTFIGFAANITYATILSWGLQYLYASFSQVLPWMTCGNSWNTENCFVPTGNGSSLYNFTSLELINGTATNNGTPIVSSVTEYWERSILGISSGIEEIGSVQTGTAVALVITWIVAFFCMFKGINWTSKITYATSTVPILLMVAMLIRGLTLDGARDGVLYFVSPNVTKLLEPQVWKDAALQNYYSLSLSGGSMIALGSFNKYNQNFFKDCIILALVNSGASLLAGFTIFSTLGFMALQQNTTVDEVAESGPGLAFVAYPQALSMMPGSQFWCVIFFLTFTLLGLDSLFVIAEALISAVSDYFSSIFNKLWKKTLLVFVMSLTTFLLGFITVTQAGMYYIYLLDNFSSTGWGLLFCGTCECIAIAWMYGIDKYYRHICDMLQFEPRFPWFKYCWKYFTPPVLLLLFIYCLILYKPLVYNHTYEYPSWAIAFGWSISAFEFMWIPGYAIYYIIKTKCFGRQEATYSEAKVDHVREEPGDVTTIF